ncbi:MAG: fibronectin type III domain-containing protein [Burkholderiales bacterium]|nr:fibronectin type III domain-containing protein [Burkholderiales bacterium]
MTIPILRTGAPIQRALLQIGLASVLAAPSVLLAAPLKAYNANPATVTVSGISSGAYMSVQTHVALSATFKTGAAVFAGGPYNCAQGNMNTALGYCMKANSASEIPVSTLVSTTNSRSSSGTIDSTSNLSNTKIYLFSGTQDTLVKQPVMDALKNYYLNYTSSGNITYNNTTGAGHSWVSPYGPNSCSQETGVYINNCSIDPEQTFLTMFYGSLNAKATPTTLKGQFIEFDQAEFFDDKKPRSHSVDDTGWAYVPANCAANKPCKVHVSFHGCQQFYEKIGDAFVKKAGLNEWADTNDIIVIYPQTIKSDFNPMNPNGCWDWWGYDDTNYDKNTGRQILMTKRIVDRVTSGWVSGSSNPAPTNLTVGTVTYNSAALSWNASTGASGYNAYRSATSGGARTKTNSSLITGTSTTVTGLNADTTYYFVVKAQDAGGLETADSNQVQTTTPSAPGGSGGIPTGLTIGTVTENSVALSWNTASGASGYNAYHSTSSSGARTKANAQLIATTSYTVTGLQSSTTYYFRVRSVDSSGLESAESSAVSTTTNSPSYCQQYTSSNYAHVQASRATYCGGYACAVGSGDNLGLYNMYTTSTLTEKPSGYYKKGGSCQDQPLTPPTGITVGTVTNNSVALSWSAGGGTGLSGYNVYYADNSLGNFSRHNSSLVTGTSYTVTGLSSGKSYNFYLRSSNAQGQESQNSDNVSATTGTSSVGTPTGVSVTGTTVSTIALSWNTVSGASGYNVYFADVANATALTKSNGSLITGTTHTITGLAGGKTYYVKVRAQDANGVEGTASTEVSATTSTASAPAAPTSLAEGSGKTSTSIPLTWTASSGPDLAGNNVYRGSTSGGPYSKLNTELVGGTTYTDSGLIASTTYYYVVRAVNTTGLESSNSNELSSTTSSSSAPAVASALKVDTTKQTTDSEVPLTWTASSGPNLSGYNVYVGNVSGGPYQKANSSLVTGTTYTVASLNADTTYYFTVKAQNTSQIESVASNEVAGKTLRSTYCKIWTNNNYNHVTASPQRATTDGTYAYSIGSGQNMGLYSLYVTTSLRESPKGYFQIGDVCGTVLNATSVSSDDGYVKAFSGGTSPEVGGLSTPGIGRGSDSKFNRSVLSFDTSAIPDDAVITRAYVVLTYYTMSGDPWANPAGNSMVVDVKNGCFGAACTMGTDDWAATADASAVATVAKWTSGTKQSSDFDSNGLAAINKTGKTQVRLRFTSNQTSMNYIQITDGTNAKLYVEYLDPSQ